MKTTLTAAAIVLAGAPLYAEGFSFGGEVDSKYNLDSEVGTITLSPEMNYGVGMWNFETSSDIAVWNNQAADGSLVLFDSLDEGSYPDLDFEVTYSLQDNLDLTAGTSWDFNEGERGDITVGASFSF